jgi:hypothetical protein
MRAFSYSLIFSYVLILLGMGLLVAASSDELRGVTYKPYAPVGRLRYNQGYLYSIPVQREQNPELFRQFMTVHWIWAVGIEGVGWILFVKNK